MGKVKIISLKDCTDNKQPVPKCDNETVYAFFDDGKGGYSRRYIAKVKLVVPFEDVKRNDKNLYNEWKREVKDYYWVFAKETDYFVSCTVFGYSEQPVWFVRTIGGGWFSLECGSFWWAGRLDVTGGMCKDLGLPEPKDWVAGVHYAGYNQN